MRCLPDSLDIVTLTNADNFSRFDAEDLPVLHEKGNAGALSGGLRRVSEEFAGEAGSRPTWMP